MQYKNRLLELVRLQLSANYSQSEIDKMIGNWNDSSYKGKRNAIIEKALYDIAVIITQHNVNTVMTTTNKFCHVVYYGKTADVLHSYSNRNIAEFDSFCNNIDSYNILYKYDYNNESVNVDNLRYKDKKIFTKILDMFKIRWEAIPSSKTIDETMYVVNYNSFEDNSLVLCENLES